MLHRSQPFLANRLALRAVLLASLLSLPPSGLDAQARYQQVLDLNGTRLGLGLEHTSWGTLAVAGYDDLDQNFLLELDRDGNLRWARRYGTGFIGRLFKDVRQTNGGYAVLGQDFGSLGGRGAMILRTGRQGQPDWAKLYTAGNADLLSHALELTADRGYAITGFVIGSPERLFVLRVDGAGTVAWGKFFETESLNGHLRGRFLRQTPDGGYVVTGDVTSGDEDVYVAKVDAGGGLEWARSYGGAGNESGVTVRPLDDGYVVSGLTDSFGAGGTDVYLLRLDLDGDLLWSRTYGGSGLELEPSLLTTSAGDFVISGSTTSFGAGGSDLFLFRVAADGQLLWGRAYGGPNDEETIDHHSQLPPAEDRAGGFYLAGNSKSFGPGSPLFVVATDGDGDVPCNTTVVSPTVTVAATVVETLSLEELAVSWTVADVDLGVTEAVLTPELSCHESPFCVPPPADLGHWYPFDGTADEIAFDNHPSVDGDPAFVPGVVGLALEFDGSGDALTSPSHPKNDVSTGDLTLDMWARIDPVNSGVRVLLEKRVLSPRVQGYSLYVFNGELGFQLADAAGPSNTCSSSASSSCTNYLSGHFLNDGQWHFIAVTVDRDDLDGIRWYVDGVEVGTRGNPTVRSGSLSNPGPLHVARHATSSDRLTGSLDEIEIFHRALSPAEVLALYHGGGRGKCKVRATAPWDVSVCLNDAVVTVPVDVCNDGTEPRTFELNAVDAIAPEPHRDRCSLEWQPSFSVTPADLTVAPGSCGSFELEISRPAGLGHGKIACFQATFEDELGRPIWVDSSLWGNGQFCCRYPVASESFSNPLPRAIEIEVTNTSGQATTLDYGVTVMAPPGDVNDVVRLNGKTPGIDVAGSISLAIGETGVLSFGVAMSSHQPGRFFDVIVNDTGTDPEQSQPLISFSLRSVPALGAAETLFSDGFESGDTAAWSFTQQ